MVGFQQTLELQKRLVVKSNGIQIFNADPGFRKNIADGIGWKSGVVLLAAEPLLVGRGDDVFIREEDGCAVVVVGGYAEY